MWQARLGARGAVLSQLTASAAQKGEKSGVSALFARQPRQGGRDTACLGAVSLTLNPAADCLAVLPGSELRRHQDIRLPQHGLVGAWFRICLSRVTRARESAGL